MLGLIESLCIGIFVSDVPKLTAIEFLEVAGLFPSLLLFDLKRAEIFGTFVGTFVIDRIHPAIVKRCELASFVQSGGTRRQFFCGSHVFFLLPSSGCPTDF